MAEYVVDECEDKAGEDDCGHCHAGCHTECEELVVYMGLVWEEGVAVCFQSVDIHADNVAARYKQWSERNHSGVDFQNLIGYVADAYAHDAQQ